MSLFLRTALLNMVAAAHLASLAASQVPTPVPSIIGRGEELRVYVMTMGPGLYVWEKFGHNAIRIVDTVRGTDIAYNYGMFSFEQEDFILRFVRGHMDYWMEGFDAAQTANAYASTDRAVWLQELDLSAVQRADLRDFLEWNALPENRVYRYDYYLDNCSTRVRDAIDRVLGGTLRAQTDSVSSGRTFREHTRNLTSDDPLIYTGLMAGLGQPVDREISAWEEMFLPMELMVRLRDITIVDEAGQRRPLVRSEVQVYVASTDVPSPEYGSRVGAYLLVGLLLAGVALALARAARKGTAGRFAFGFVASAWCMVAGTLGVVLLGLWLFTDHSAAYRNENLFILNPLLLPLGVLLPIAISGWGRAHTGSVRLCQVVAACSVIGFVVQVLPGLDQANGEMIALGLPINLALLVAAGWIASPSATSTSASGSRSGGAEPVAARLR